MLTQWNTGVLGHYSDAESQYWKIHLGEGLYLAGGAVPCSKVMVWASKVLPGPYRWLRHGQQFDICFPRYYQIPIDVTGSLFTQLGRLEQCEQSFRLKQQQHQSGHTRNQTHNLLISRLMHWSSLGSHTHTHARGGTLYTTLAHTHHTTSHHTRAHTPHHTTHAYSYHCITARSIWST